MNRQERRKAAQKGTSAAGILAQDRKDTQQRVSKEATDFAVRGLSAAFMVILHDKFGFGQVRLQRVLQYVNSYFDSIVQGEINLDDLERTVLDEFNIKLK